MGQQADRATFVLVSGAWHAGWCWERVVPLLEARGHRVLAPDLLGMGDEPTPLAEVTLARWADQIADLIRAQPEPVVLVGHSRGGLVISETAERVPDHIRTLVYLTALMVPPGATLRDLSAATGHTLDLRPMLLPGPEDGTTVIRPDAVSAVLYNTTAPEWQARAAAKLSPEPMRATGGALQLTADRFGRVPRAYIEALQDRALSIQFQRAMRTALPCDPVEALDTDHSPFFSAPAELADALERIALQLR